MPALATVKVSFSTGTDDQQLCLDAPGMPQQRVPLASDAYEAGPTLQIECAGDNWSLASLSCKQHLEGSEWITQYLNSRPMPNARCCVSGKSLPGTFALVRSIDACVVHLGQYPPIFPLIARAKHDPVYEARFAGNYRRLSDFAPLLLVSQSSARFVAKQCQADCYPTVSFRGNIVVDGAPPWAEETWAELDVVASSSSTDQNGAAPPLRLHTIKQCPRCTVPCRDQTTGEFLFPNEKFKLWNVLKKAFPRKSTDPEWGSWAGAYMGVYMGSNGVEGTVAVGDTIVPRKIVRWDAHLQTEKRNTCFLVLLIAGGLALVGMGLIPKTTI
jgi:MOSC domain